MNGCVAFGTLSEEGSDGAANADAPPAAFRFVCPVATRSPAFAVTRLENEAERRTACAMTRCGLKA